MSNLFTQSARWYDAIYQLHADYEAAATAIDQLARDRFGDRECSLLDVACGTGLFLQEIEKLRTYRREGLDLDTAMLDIARKRLPDVPLHEADMASFDLGRQFDIITCLGSSLAAVATYERLEEAVTSFAMHLAPGGMLIVEPFITPDEWEPGRLSANYVDEPDLKVTRISRSDRRDDIAIMTFQYFIATPEVVEQFEEVHELGLFTDDDYQRAFRDAGLTGNLYDGGLLGRGAWIATK